MFEPGAALPDGDPVVVEDAEDPEPGDPAAIFYTSGTTGFPTAVRSVSYGGAPIAPDLVARLAKAFPAARLGNGFGLLAGASGVYEAAVLGVRDEMMGEKVGAVIVPVPGTTLDVPAVLDYLGGHIADFKIPQYVAVSAAPLPRNPGGKLLKRRLREETDWSAAARR